MNIPEQVLTTDVLVVGAGIAGSFAAIRAKELGANVVIVEHRLTTIYSGLYHFCRVDLSEND